MPHLSSRFQVSTFSRFEVIGFSTSGCRIRNFAPKKHKDAEVSIEKTKCHNCHNIDLGAETAFSGASKFEDFILLLLLVFELELFKPPIGISVFWLGNPCHETDFPKICTKNASYVHHLSSKFQVSIFSLFEVVAISGSGCGIRRFARKKQRDLLGSPNTVLFVFTQRLKS